MELASAVDAGELLVKATYIMKGDVPLVFSAYEDIWDLCSTIFFNLFYPNVRAAAELTGCS